MGSVDELSTDSVKDIIDHVRKGKRKRPDKDSICREAELRHGLDKDTVAHMLDKLTLENKLYIKESYFVNESQVNENDQLSDIVLHEEPKLTEVDDKQTTVECNESKARLSPTHPINPARITKADSIHADSNIFQTAGDLARSVIDLNQQLGKECDLNLRLLEENFNLKSLLGLNNKRLQETINEQSFDTLDNESELDESPKIVYENIQVENNNGNDKKCTKTNKNNRKRNNKRRNKKARSSAQIDLTLDGTPSGDQNNQNVGSNAGIILNAEAQISAESSSKKQQPSANSLADGYSPVIENSQQPSANSLADDSSPVNENSQPSTSATSCENSNSKVPNKKNVPAVGENQPSTSNILYENKKTKLWVKRQKRSAVILGDSIVKNINAWELKKKIGENNNIYVKCFNGANIKDMHSYAKPSIERKPNLIILHIGKNDLAQRRNEAEKSAVQIAHEIIELANEMRVNGTEVVISGLVPRGDEFETKRKRVNLILADLCSENDYAFIEHTNIDASKHLNQSRIHLNRTGANLFESNLVRALRY
eukprot:Seg2143.1 transcript_id=Seg2143.1/GoldUCD/mRNA.D3Y31 product="hypothetical protein" protein_id=Seg2143.1/GoldUCD/D3Y31